MSEQKSSLVSADQDIKRVAQETNLLPVLMLALVFVLFVVPIAGAVPFAGGLLRLGITAVLLLAVIATLRKRMLFVGGLFVVAVAAPLSWVAMFVDRPIVFVTSCALNSLFFVAIAVMILVSVIRKHVATVHSIFGAISSYLLLGLAWAVLYWGLDHVNDQAFHVALPISAAPFNESVVQVKELSQFIYFSFVTMSTLGYGDITPRTPLAQTLTWMQSVTGQFYIAVLVAWLVSEIPRQREKAP